MSSNVIQERIEQISDFLAKRRDLIDNDFAIFLKKFADETKVEPTSKIMSDLKMKVEELSTDIVKHKLIQISGTESKAVQPLLKKESKKGQKLDMKLENIENEEAFINLLYDLEFILVKDGREIPPENQKCLEDYKNYITSISEDCHDFEPRDLLPRSSTIQRFIENEIYYNDFDKIDMDLDWLIDTETNLGKGRQAIVRLMLFGGHQYVAVKAINMNKKNRFYEEAEIWKKLRTTSFNSKRSIPKLFGTEVVTTKDGKKIRNYNHRTWSACQCHFQES